MPELFDNRQYLRLNLNFQVKLIGAGLDSPTEGITRNLSQTGTLIKTRQLPALRLQDIVHVAILVPPSFSGHDVTIALQGKAVVIRLDLPNRYVAIQFVKKLKQFDRIDNREINVG